MPSTVGVTSTVRALHGEIGRALATAAGGPARTVTNPHHATPLVAYGVPAEAWRELARGWRAAALALSMDERVALARRLFASHIEEEGHVALLLLRADIDGLTPSTFERLDGLLDGFSSWSMVDDFASGEPGITHQLLARHERETLALLARWRRSPNLWKRRAGVVTFTRATAAGGRYVDEVLSFSEAMQWDGEDLVQKADGWALKDTMRAGPGARRRVMALVKRMRRTGVPSTITLYAIRDVRGPERAAILALRGRRAR
jgi:3-methyladenine DNA glycosylase AlkD